VDRTDIIQRLISKIDAKSYLEIGLGNGKNFKEIKCKIKIGVDPCLSDGSHLADPSYRMTSDEYFRDNKQKFDVIFIDGLHIAWQVERDIENALKVLNEGGYIVCHDINPIDEASQIVPRVQKQWNGDCWKAWVKIRANNPNLKMYVVDTDSGCGVIQRGSQKLVKLGDQKLTYANFVKNKKHWLNLISVDEYLGR
jgi:SAM-dependent methyltransferase